MYPARRIRYLTRQESSELAALGARMCSKTIGMFKIRPKTEGLGEIIDWIRWIRTTLWLDPSK